MDLTPLELANEPELQESIAKLPTSCHAGPTRDREESYDGGDSLLIQDLQPIQVTGAWRLGHPSGTRVLRAVPSGSPISSAFRSQKRVYESSPLSHWYPISLTSLERVAIASLV